MSKLKATSTRNDGTHVKKWIRPEKRLAIYIRDGFCCLYCGTHLKGAVPSFVQLDHLVARSAGGSNDATNLVTACGSCNGARGSKLYTDYATGGAIERIEATRVQPINVALAKALIADTAGDASAESAR